MAALETLSPECREDGKHCGPTGGGGGATIFCVRKKKKSLGDDQQQGTTVGGCVLSKLMQKKRVLTSHSTTVSQQQYDGTGSLPQTIQPTRLPPVLPLILILLFSSAK